MYQLDKAKIEQLLKSLGNAGKNAVTGLNTMTDGEFKGSAMETDPLGHLGLIVRTLENARAKAQASAQYAGLSVEEISQAQADERAGEQQAILDKFNKKLAARQPQATQPDPDDEEIDESAPDTGQSTGGQANQAQQTGESADGQSLDPDQQPPQA